MKNKAKMSIETARKIMTAYLAGDENASCFSQFADGGEPADEVMDQAADEAEKVIDADEESRS